MCYKYERIQQCTFILGIISLSEVVRKSWEYSVTFNTVVRLKKIQKEKKNIYYIKRKMKSINVVLHTGKKKLCNAYFLKWIP